jgi:hypothetical protein
MDSRNGKRGKLQTKAVLSFVAASAVAATLLAPITALALTKDEVACGGPGWRLTIQKDPITKERKCSCGKSIAGGGGRMLFVDAACPTEDTDAGTPSGTQKGPGRQVPGQKGPKPTDMMR